MAEPVTVFEPTDDDALARAELKPVLRLLLGRVSLLPI